MKKNSSQPMHPTCWIGVQEQGELLQLLLVDGSFEERARALVERDRVSFVRMLRNWRRDHRIDVTGAAFCIDRHARMMQEPYVLLIQRRWLVYQVDSRQLVDELRLGSAEVLDPMDLIRFAAGHRDELNQTMSEHFRAIRLAYLRDRKARIESLLKDMGSWRVQSDRRAEAVVAREIDRLDRFHALQLTRMLQRIERLMASQFEHD